jgi:hypothetical protein
MKKQLSWIFVIVLVANILLFSFTVISAGIFWAVIVISAIVAYWVIPRVHTK